jgi:hypothetical protein
MSASTVTENIRVPNDLIVKPLQWTDSHGDGYRCSQADTPYGRFVYGVDRAGIAYHSGPTALDKVPLGGNPHAVKVTPHEEIDHESEEAARAAAEALYAGLVLAQIASLTVSAVKEIAAAPKLDPRVLAAVSLLRTSLEKYADDCQEARSWGGPTIYPVHPIDERYAKNSAATLEIVEAAFKK